MSAIEDLISQMKQELLADLLPSAPRRLAEIEKNQFGQRRFGSDGTVVIAYGLNGAPLKIVVIGSDEDPAVLDNVFVETVRTISLGDVSSAQRYAEVLEAVLGTALIADETGRRRIRRAAGQGRVKEAVPEGFVRDQKTGKLRPRLRAGRRAQTVETNGVGKK